MAGVSYEDWSRTFHGRAFLRRSAERNAAFLRPQLEPGMRLLDLGCGPGTITAGLAEWIAPGTVIGVDLNHDFLTTGAAAYAGAISFARGDAADLPLATGSVDVAFAHAVLQHVLDPHAVLREIRRAVRPGGVAALADADLSTFLLHPRSDPLDAWSALIPRTRRNPTIGRELPSLLAGAGFAEVSFAVSASPYEASAIASVAAANVAQLTAEPFVAHAVANGWGEPQDLAEMAEAWRLWAQEPGALFVNFWCTAIGR